MALLRNVLLPLMLTIGAGSISAGVEHRAGQSTVMPCARITLTASYLAEAAPGAGPGFLFRIENKTAHAIRLERPIPSSAHWYAEVGNRWLWRSSAGRGGALVDAERQKGPMFAYRPTAMPADPQYLTVPAHGVQQWAEAMRDHPAINYDPSCPMCNYPGESQYQAIFAYAYLPAPDEHEPDLLRCGLRSAPVPMPPHPAGAGKSH